MESLLSLPSLVPWIRVFVTSRNEPGIRDVVNRAEQQDRCFSFNVNEDSGTREDIRRYICAKLPSLRVEPPLSEQENDVLVDQSEGLFIWCSTLFRHYEGTLLARQALEPFLRKTKERQKPLPALHRLYETILSTAAGHPDNIPLFHTFLALLSLVAKNRPLSQVTMANLLHGHAFHQGNTGTQSAGCVRMNRADAEFYFNNLNPGDRVFIW